MKVTCAYFCLVVCWILGGFFPARVDLILFLYNFRNINIQACFRSFFPGLTFER